jgi:FAD/FMN-containing dehydrogenase
MGAGAIVLGASTVMSSESATGTTASRRSTKVSPPTAVDWSALGRRLSGTLIRPGEVGYRTAVELSDPSYDVVSPQGVAYCASASDVVSCVEFVRNHGILFSARAGGHSYAGYSTSTGLVIDVTRLAGVQPGSDSIAVVGAGVRLIDVYSTLGAQSLALPGGSCPTVGIAGLALGGGVGVLGRKFGLTCDNLLGAQVVLASGEQVRASAGSHPDLYWALRGGGGGNFGIVTSFTFQCHPIGELGLFTLVWPWSSAAQVISAWLEWAPNAPDELWSNCQLLNDQSTPQGVGPAARVTGVYVGDLDSLESLLAPFLASVDKSPFTRFVGAAAYPQAMMIEAGCEGDTVPECHLPSENPAGILTRQPWAAKSDYVDTALPQAGVESLVAAVEQRHISPVLSGGGIVLDASGGAINAVAPGATAFVHRTALASLQYSAIWQTGDPVTTITANHQWLQTAWQSMRPYVNGEAYQNYIDPTLARWREAYYGANLPRLEQIKRAYDPGNLFRFSQSIPI